MNAPQSRQDDRHAAAVDRQGISYVIRHDAVEKHSATAQAALFCDRLIEQRFPPVNFHEMEENE